MWRWGGDVCVGGGCRGGGGGGLYALHGPGNET